MDKKADSKITKSFFLVKYRLGGCFYELLQLHAVYNGRCSNRRF